MKKKIPLTLAAFALSLYTTKAIPFGGIEFPEGEKSFADEVFNDKPDTGVVSDQLTSLEIDRVVGVIRGDSYHSTQLRDVLSSQTGTPLGKVDLDSAGAISITILDVPESSSSTVFIGLGLGLLFFGSMTHRKGLSSRYRQRRSCF